MRGAFAVLFVTLTVPAFGQGSKTVYSEPFNTFDGWTVVNSSATVGWFVDATPATVVASPSFFSAPNSMNYNDGVDFDDAGLPSNGTVTSPFIDISKLTAPVLGFACNYETETTGVTFDQRFVEISNDGFATNLFSEQLSGVPGGAVTLPCAAMGTWHGHTVPMFASWGNIQVRFRFNTVDGVLNGFDGWFIDDVSISHSPKTPSDHRGANGFLPCAADARSAGASTPTAVAMIVVLLAIAARRI